MKKFDRYIFIFIGLGIWTLAIVQIIKPTITYSIQKYTSADKTDLEEFVQNIVNPVKKELEDIRNDVFDLQEKVDTLQWHDHGG